MRFIVKNKVILFISICSGSLYAYTYNFPEYSTEWRWNNSCPSEELRMRSYKSREIKQFISDYFTILEEFLVTESLEEEKIVIEKFFVLINSLESITQKWEPGFGDFYKIPPMSTEGIQRNLILVLKEEWRTFVHASPLVTSADKKGLKGKLTRLVNYPYGSKAFRLFYGFLNRTRLP